ncbi:MAG TPA: TonB-dependent receptor [Steroidobacteraceae bacterium]|jgi:outer membrane receptor protein involved in Fe transport|nr:TonB-dependent receptor [Steroidobacteraceae bacterium]
MTQRRRRGHFAGGLKIGSIAVLTQLPVLPASAQTAPPSVSTDATGDLQEVVVTAERHTSTVQKTALSITVVTGEQLAEQGLSTIRDVAAQVPGISMRSSGPGQTEYEMRGLPSSGGSSATVGLYLNDVPLSAPAAALNGKVTIDPDLFDLSRVEVLRGPQGTLYGSGSMGGTIRLITNLPKLDETEASVEVIPSVTRGGFNWGGNAMVNLPVVQDRLAVRLVGTYKFNAGWIDRDVVDPFPIGPGGACGFGTCTRGDVSSAPIAARFPRSNWERIAGGRASVRFQPSDPLTIDFMGMYQRIGMGAPNQVDDPPGVDALAHYSPFDIPEPYSDTYRLYSLNVNYDLGFAQLTSATSHWSRESSWTGDTSEQNQSLLSVYFGFPDLIPASYENNDFSKQTSEELRLASSGQGPWQWVVGGFFSKFESVFDQYAANPAYAVLAYGGPAANPDGIGYQAHNPYDIKQFAAFGESSYQLDNGLKATVGLRWYRYDTDLTFEQSGNYSQTGNASQFTGAVSSSDSGVNPKFNLAYLPNEHLTLYAQASKGFRPGGVNLPVPVPPCTEQAPLSYKPDSLWSYELGEKGRFLGGRLTVNSDLYYIRWSNVQQLLTPPCAFPNTQNAGNAISYGPELEIAAQLTPDLMVSINGAYTEAHITDVNPASAGQALGGTTPLVPGLPLENVPRYTANAALNYSHPLGNGYRLISRVSATATGPSHDISYYFQELPGYTIANARLGVSHGPLETFLFVDNLADKLAVVTIDTMAWSLPVPSLTRPAITTPRTIGVDLTYKF